MKRSVEFHYFCSQDKKATSSKLGSEGAFETRPFEKQEKEGSRKESTLCNEGESFKGINVFACGGACSPTYSNYIYLSVAECNRFSVFGHSVVGRHVHSAEYVLTLRYTHSWDEWVGWGWGQWGILTVAPIQSIEAVEPSAPGGRGRAALFFYTCYIPRVLGTEN